MGSCPKCGLRVKRKRKSSGVRECRRHGPIEKNNSPKHISYPNITRYYMKSAHEWAQEFLNKYPINTRGNGEIEAFFKEIQWDAAKKEEVSEQISDKILSLGLKRVAIVLHALAFQMAAGKSRDETLALVTIVSDAAYRLEDLDKS